MAGNRNTTAPGAPEQPTVTALHARWKRILDDLNTPGVPTPRRENKLIEAGRLEREIGQTPAAGMAEIITKIRIVLTGQTTAALSESALLAGAIEDLERMRKE